LKVVYSAEFPALPSDLAGRSFKRVFGATQSCMELFLLKRDLMGPCWLNIKVIDHPSVQVLPSPVIGG
jgi:DNA polymerase alpha subunit A